MDFGPGNRDWSPLFVVFVGLLMLSGATLPMQVGGQEANAGRIVTVEESGDAVVTTFNDTTYLWQSERATVNVTYQINASEDQYAICRYENASADVPTECKSNRVGNGSTANASFTLSNASTGNRTFYLELRPAFGADVPTIDSRNVTYHVVEKSGDEDQDGLTNAYERNETRNGDWPDDAFVNSDMDNDSLSDGQEATEYATSPLKKDSDGDGLSDVTELGNDKTLPRDPDTDGDGIVDGNDSAPADVRSPGTSTPTTATTTSKGVSPDDFSQSQLFLLGLFGAGVLGATVLLWRSGTDRDDPGPAAESSGSADVAVPVRSSGARDASDAANDEPVTDEGRVLDLLRENGGRMKQTDLVEETGWSKSKVSRLLSRMEERDMVNRLRVGRGNIVYLDGKKPSGAHSPHEEDSYS